MAQDYRILKVTAGAATNGQVKMYDVSGNAATLTAPSLGGNVTITLPATTATLAGKGLNETISGNWTFTGTVTLGAAATGPGVVPLGAVLATFPNLSGAYSCGTTTSADSNGYVKCNGGTISDGTSPMNGQTVPNINNTVFLAGSTTAGSAGGASTVSLSSANLAAHTHSVTPNMSVSGTGSSAGSVNVAAANHVHSMLSHTHAMTHYHQWSYQSNNGGSTPNSVYSKATASTSSGTYTTNGDAIFGGAGGGGGYSNGANTTGLFFWPTVNAGAYYTTGSLGDPGGGGSSAATSAPSTANTGVENQDTLISVTLNNGTAAITSGSTGSGTAFSILPTYISAVYVMRIK